MTYNSERFAPLPDGVAERWTTFLNWDKEYFPNRMGLVLDELKTDYARVSLAWDDRNTQPAGVIHGGAIATVIDTVVVPAIGMGLPEGALWSTIELHVQYHKALLKGAVGEGWVVKRGKSIVFTRAEVHDTDGALVASGTATYSVRLPAS